MRPVRKTTRRGFTLVELLVSITIMTILAGMALFAMFRAQQQARMARTRTQIAKINELLMQKWESYKARPVSAKYSPPAQGGMSNAAYRRLVYTQQRRFRLVALRDLMRMELPDRITDVLDGPAPAVTGLAPPSVRTSYLQQWASAEAIAGAPTWTTTHQSSECLYLILSAMRDGESSALNFFRSEEIGDTDGDGMNEILDGMGRPIYFLRWAPAFSQTVGADGAWGVAGLDDDSNGIIDDNPEAGWPGSDDITISDMQTRNAAKSPDFFDILLADPRFRDHLPPAPTDANNAFAPFGLFPLVYSAGEDGVYDIYQADESGAAVPIAGPPGSIFRAVLTQWPSGSSFPSDPYTTPATSSNLANTLGTVLGGGAADNVFNHNLETRGN